MGFLDRIKRRLFGEQQVKPLTPLMINAGMAAQGQSFIISKLEPSVKTGFENMNQTMQDFTSMILTEMHKSEERIIQHMDNMLQTLSMAGDVRINKEEVLKEFEKTTILTMKELKDRLKVSTETLNYHLKNLEKDGSIAHTGYGQYAKVLNNINIETPKETDTQVEEGVE